jgi:hypothetical protein
MISHTQFPQIMFNPPEQYLIREKEELFLAEILIL